MKTFFEKVAQWAFTHHDLFIEVKDIAKVLSLVLFGWIPTINLLHDYGINADYGFFAIFGQLLGYIARYNFSYIFPKIPNLAITNWWVRLGGNIVLSWTFGIFMTPIMFRYIDDKTLSIVAVAVCVGMFYDLILIPLVAVSYKMSEWIKKKWIGNFETETQEEPQQKIKIQGITGDEGLDGTGSPGVKNRPPNG